MSGKERLRRNRLRPKEKTISRRSFLRLSTVLSVGVAAAAVGGAAWAVDWYRRNQAIEDKLAEFRKKEAELDEFLIRFEAGYSRFAEKAKTVIKTRITDLQTRKTYRFPLKCLR